MRKYNLDLHIHTVLSPCADLLMTPGNIIKKAEEIGLDIIAITDHNSAENISSAISLSKDSSVKIIPGMEVETAEEIHLLTFFPDLKSVKEWQRVVYANLPDLKNDEEYFGYQIITDEHDEYIAKEERLLATAVNLTISEVVKRVKKMGGVVIPSHIDRSYSIIKNLGFIPENLELFVLEISKRGSFDRLKTKFPYLNDYILIRNSDSHYLDDIDQMIEIKLKKFSFDNLFTVLKSNNFICK